MRNWLSVVKAGKKGLKYKQKTYNQHEKPLLLGSMLCLKPQRKGQMTNYGNGLLILKDLEG